MVDKHWYFVIYTDNGIDSMQAGREGDKQVLCDLNRNVIGSRQVNTEGDKQKFRHPHR